MALNINGTTGISGVDGSVSAPAVTGTDSNTGITFPSADTIKFSTGGVERMSITNSGVTGVGGGGKLLKYDYLEYSSEFSTNSTSYVDVTSMAFDFTPSAAGSKIWLMCTPMVACEDQIQTATGFVALRSGSTTLFETKEWRYTYTSQNYQTVYSRNLPIQYIHTPTYTLGDSINYKLSIKKDTSEIRVNYNSQGKSNFSIFEIGA